VQVSDDSKPVLGKNKRNFILALEAAPYRRQYHNIRAHFVRVKYAACTPPNVRLAEQVLEGE